MTESFRSHIGMLLSLSADHNGMTRTGCQRPPSKLARVRHMHSLDWPQLMRSDSASATEWPPCTLGLGCRGRPPGTVAVRETAELLFRCSVGASTVSAGAPAGEDQPHCVHPFEHVLGRADRRIADESSPPLHRECGTIFEYLQGGIWKREPVEVRGVLDPLEMPHSYG